MGTCHWASGGLVGGGDSSQKCPIGDVSLPPKELRVSRPPNERPWGLWGLSHSSHKNQRRRGPGYLRLADTPAHPPLGGSMTSTNSGYSAQVGQGRGSRRASAATTREQLLSSFPGHRDTGAELCSFPPRGKWDGRPGWSVLPWVPLSPTLTGSSPICPCPRLAPQKNLTPLDLPGSHPPTIVPNLSGASPMGAPPLLASGQQVLL